MIWLISISAWLDLNALVFAALYTRPALPPGHTATIIDLSERRRKRHGDKT
jgi:hypothetical protein